MTDSPDDETFERYSLFFYNRLAMLENALEDAPLDFSDGVKEREKFRLETAAAVDALLWKAANEYCLRMMVLLWLDRKDRESGRDWCGHFSQLAANVFDEFWEQHFPRNEDAAE